MTSSLFFCRSSLLDSLESFGKRGVFLDVDSHFMTQIVIMIQISSQEKVVVLGSPFQVKCCFSNFSISVFFFREVIFMQLETWTTGCSGLTQNNFAGEIHSL